MSCPSCQSEAVVATQMRGTDPYMPLFTCSTCGALWSLRQCESRNCRETAVIQCGECRRLRCKGHGGGRSGVCAACVRRVARLMKPEPLRPLNPPRTVPRCPTCGMATLIVGHTDCDGWAS